MNLNVNPFKRHFSDIVEDIVIFNGVVIGCTLLLWSASFGF